MLVVTLLAHGCPVQAIVTAFGFDERTVCEWLRRSGAHCREVHERLVGEQKFELGQVQADEIRVKAQGDILWLAQAIMVNTRLWLGGVVGQRRDFSLIAALVAQVHKVALCRELMLAADGLASYVSAFRQAFRVPLYTGKPGRPPLVPWPNIAIVQVINAWRVFSVSSAASLKAARRWSGAYCVRAKGAASSTPPTSSGSTPPSGSAWLVWQGTAVLWRARR